MFFSGVRMVELEGSEKLFGMVLGMVLILMLLKCLYLLGSSMASLATSSAEEPPSRWFFVSAVLKWFRIFGHQ